MCWVSLLCSEETIPHHIKKLFMVLKRWVETSVNESFVNGNHYFFAGKRGRWEWLTV